MTIETYPEMNDKIVELLRICSDDPSLLYAAQRIEELEAEAKRLRHIQTRMQEIGVPGILREHAANLSGFLGKAKTKKRIATMESRIETVRKCASMIESESVPDALPCGHGAVAQEHRRAGTM